MSTSTPTPASTRAPSLPPSGPSTITLVPPQISKLSRFTGSYHSWAEAIRSTLILSDPHLWAVTQGQIPHSLAADFVAVEILNLKACAWIFLHLPDDILQVVRPVLGVESDAGLLWKTVRRKFAPEECTEGNTRCGVCRPMKLAYAGPFE